MRFCHVLKGSLRNTDNIVILTPTDVDNPALCPNSVSIPTNDSENVPIVNGKVRGSNPLGSTKYLQKYSRI